ncbi:HAD family hydrolase [Paenibacillus oceani]|uniref:Uncharacterized protein n=1 Tax=Paenibacillus oceani TaxID=2772510 RepID=A0A927C5A3_9BACL|nr:hypothetical protein [Paenibacillus oceani]MBD2861614.1 hypothetical protein [Paenibacillus oceani]
MREIKGIELIKKIEAIAERDDTDPVQPEQCAGCVWGTWTGVKQYCPWQHCKR